MTKKRLAYVFPGQGSQEVGMGEELYLTFPEARKIFEEADETLGFHLSKLCFKGPVEELTKTSNAQPAILAVSVAYLRATPGIQSLGKPTFMAGHSLGEYTALVAAGALDFREALWLTRERGRLMEEAGEKNPGGMVAVIGLDGITLEAICQETGVQIANINSPEQLVISGAKDPLIRAMDLARANGARRIIPLETSEAFHSQLMEPVVEGMKEALSQVPFRQAKIPVITNTTAQPMTTTEAIKEELLMQLCLPVNWVGSVEYMIERGISTFVEIGPGRVLSGLIKRIKSEAKIIPLGLGNKG